MSYFEMIKMSLLQVLGIDPKEYAKVEAKIGLELAVSGRLEHKIKTLLRERIDGFEVEDLIENETPYAHCELAMEVNGGKYCLDCENSEEYGYCCGVKVENGEYDDMYHNYDCFETCVGGCEARFWGVCSAIENDDHKICEKCPEREEVIEDFIRYGIFDEKIPKDQSTLVKYLSISKSELDIIEQRIDWVLKDMGLMHHRVEKIIERREENE